MNRPGQGQQGRKICTGFTLVEVLVAILIFSIVMFTLFSSFNAFMLSSEKVKQEVVKNEKILNLFKRISMDLESIYILQLPRFKNPQFSSEPDPYGFVGKQETFGGQTFSHMSFASLAHTQFGYDQRSGVARISYYIEENQNHGYDLHRADFLPPFPEEMNSCSDPVLCRDISMFEVVFLDHNGDEYRSWDSDTKEFGFTFPASIDLKFTFGAGEKQVFEISIVLASGRISSE